MPQLNILPINVSKSVDIEDESTVLNTSSSKDDFSQYLSKNQDVSNYRKREVDNRLDENTVKTYRPHETTKVAEKTPTSTDESLAPAEATDSAINTQEVATSGKNTETEINKEHGNDDVQLPDESELLMSFLVKADQTLVGESALKAINLDEVSAEQKAKLAAQNLLKSSDLVANLSDIAKALKPNSELLPTELSEQEQLAKALLDATKASKENVSVSLDNDKLLVADKDVVKENGQKTNLETSKIAVDNLLALEKKLANSNIFEQQLNAAKLIPENTVENDIGDKTKLTTASLKTSVQSQILVDKNFNKVAMDEAAMNEVEGSQAELNNQQLKTGVKNTAASKVNLAPVLNTKIQIDASVPSALNVAANIDEQEALLTANINGATKQAADLSAASTVAQPIGQNNNNKNLSSAGIGQASTDSLMKQSDLVASQEQLNAKSVESLIAQSKELSAGDNKDVSNKVAVKTTADFAVNSNFVDVTGKATQVAQQITEQQVTDIFNLTGSSEVSQSQKTNAQLHQETISIFRKDFAEAVKDKVMLIISQKLQQFDISLDPPELGNIHVRVNLQGEQASVNFVVQNQQAKDAFEQNMHKLKELLAEQGVNVGDANVEQQSDREDNNDEKSADNQQRLMASTADASDVVEHNLSAKMINSASTAIDFYA